MYATGQGVPEDDAEAMYWYKLAAEQGVIEAHFSLGFIYATGHGAPKDDVQAYAWLSVAAAQGHELSKETKYGVAKNMTPDQIAAAQKLSNEYWEAFGPDRKNQ